MHLLPCPFCKSKNPLFNMSDRISGPMVIKPGWYVRCRSAKCGARIDAGTAPAAMKRWNTRPEETSAAPAPAETQTPEAES